MRNKARSGGGNPAPDKVVDNGEDVWNMSDEDFKKMDLSSIR